MQLSEALWLFVCTKRFNRSWCFKLAWGPSTAFGFRLTSLRCNENKKGVPPRVEYVLEAQALKEARDDPRWRRSSPEILLHDGFGSKRQNRTEWYGDE